MNSRSDIASSERSQKENEGYAGVGREKRESLRSDHFEEACLKGDRASHPIICLVNSALRIHKAYEESRADFFLCSGLHLQQRSLLCM